MAFQIIREDITRISADAIVNTANPDPVFGEGTDLAVYTAAGREKMLEERQKVGPMEPGSVFVTPGFSLPARYVIHTVVPFYEEEERDACMDLLRSCYQRCLEKALEMNFSSIAFPLLGSGSNGYDRSDSLKCAIEVCSHFLMSKQMKILLAVFDKASFALSEKVFEGVDSYLEDHYVDKILSREYSSFHISGSVSNRRRRKEHIFPLHGLIQKKEEMEDACEEREERSLDEVVRNIQETFQQSLLHWIDRKGYTDSEVYKRAGIDRKLFSKIRSNKEYHPKKETALALCVALNLSLDDTKDLMAKAGYALSPSSKWDMIIEYFIASGVFDTYTINLALLEHGQKMLC